MIENGADGGSDFFVAGGTLRYNSPSYVKRPADDELLQAVRAGEFCYVLTPRQMGKSSLMVRTSRRLQSEGVRTAILDLTSIGTEVTAEQWYLGLANRLATRLRLRMDVQAWWEERDSIGVVQRFSDFLADVVLEQIDEQVIIFVDEIDATLNVPFSDDFFAAIRAFYNARADNARFDRLSFVLLGVATPADLMKDRTRTPFNIGRRIDLKEFSHDDAGVLRDGMVACYPQQGEAIFNRVYYWTNGHPYLTQRLCLSAAEQDSIEDGVQWVDQAVDALFLAEAARRETNLQFIRDYIGRFPAEEQRVLLDLYGQVHSGRRVVDDDRSIPQNQLKLLGLVQAEGDHLVVRNEVYGHVFNQEWIKETRPVDWNRRIAIFVGIAVVLAAVGLAAFLWRGSQDVQSTEEFIAEQKEFFDTENPASRLLALANMFGRDEPQTIAEAQQWFNELTPEERIAIFEDSEGLDARIPEVILPLTLTFPTITEDKELLAAMADALQRIDADSKLAEGINEWRVGRERKELGQWRDADRWLLNANLSLPGHPVIYYERARVNIMEGNEEGSVRSYDTALLYMDKIITEDDLNTTISANLLESSLPLLQQDVLDTLLQEPGLHARLFNSQERYSEWIAQVPTPTPAPTPTLTPAPVAVEVPATAPAETATESPSPTIAATQTATPTSTPDMTATFWAGCTRDLEVVDKHTYRDNNVLWATTNAPFDLYWTLQNSGTCPWPADLNWTFIEGEDFGYTGDPIPLEIEIFPGDTIELETQRVFRAPGSAGKFSSTWQLVDADGNSFGPPRTFTITINRSATATPTPRPTSIAVTSAPPPSSGGGGGSSGGGNVSPPPTDRPPDNAPSTAVP